MSRKLVVDAEWLETALKSTICPDRFLNLPCAGRTECITCAECWEQYGNGEIRPLTPAEENAGRMVETLQSIESTVHHHLYPEPNEYVSNSRSLAQDIEGQIILMKADIQKAKSTQPEKGVKENQNETQQ